MKSSTADSSAPPLAKDENEPPKIDHFQRLPNDIVVQIFGKVSEAKNLCMCYVVSKRFASLVLQTRTVSIRVQDWLVNPHSGQKFKNNMIYIAGFFGKFKQVHSLHLEMNVVQRPEEHGYVVKYTAKSMDQSIIVLAFKWSTSTEAKAKVHNREGGKDFTISNASGSIKNEIRSLCKKLKYRFEDNYLRYAVVKSIMKSFPKLKDAVVTDTMKQGRLFVGGASLNKMKEKVKSWPPKEDDSPHEGRTKVWHQPVLRLPVSGLVIEGATVVIIKEDGVADEVSIAENAFEEKEFCEAAMELVKKIPYSDVPWAGLGDASSVLCTASLHSFLVDLSCEL